MINLHCPASGYGCGYSGNFLVCPIQVHLPEELLVDWGLKSPRKERVRGGCSAHGRGDAAFIGEGKRKKGMGNTVHRSAYILVPKIEHLQCRIRFCTMAYRKKITKTRAQNLVLCRGSQRITEFPGVGHSTEPGSLPRTRMANHDHSTDSNEIFLNDCSCLYVRYTLHNEQYSLTIHALY